jgi:hypothetical protein
VTWEFRGSTESGFDLIEKKPPGRDTGLESFPEQEPWVSSYLPCGVSATLVPGPPAVPCSPGIVAVGLVTWPIPREAVRTAR